MNGKFDNHNIQLDWEIARIQHYQGIIDYIYQVTGCEKLGLQFIGKSRKTMLRVGQTDADTAKAIVSEFARKAELEITMPLTMDTIKIYAV